MRDLTRCHRGQFDTQEQAVGCHEQRVAVFTERAVARRFASHQRAEVLAFWAEHQHAARARREQVAGACSAWR